MLPNALEDRALPPLDRRGRQHLITVTGKDDLIGRHVVALVELERDRCWRSRNRPWRRVGFHPMRGEVRASEYVADPPRTVLHPDDRARCPCRCGRTAAASPRERANRAGDADQIAAASGSRNRRRPALNLAHRNRSSVSWRDWLLGCRSRSNEPNHAGEQAVVGRLTNCADRRTDCSGCVCRRASRRIGDRERHV